MREILFKGKRIDNGEWVKGAYGNHTPFVEVDNFTCPDWAENEPDRFPEYLIQQNLLEVANICEVIGNIHDNPELEESNE